jgi:hypothetical protein
MKGSMSELKEVWKVSVILMDSFFGNDLIAEKMFDSETEARSYADEVDTRKKSNRTPEVYVAAFVKKI